jgi:hypothetical protein
VPGIGMVGPTRARERETHRVVAWWRVAAWRRVAAMERERSRRVSRRHARPLPRWREPLERGSAERSAPPQVLAACPEAGTSERGPSPSPRRWSYPRTGRACPVAPHRPRRRPRLESRCRRPVLRSELHRPRGCLETGEAVPVHRRPLHQRPRQPRELLEQVSRRPRGCRQPSPRHAPPRRAHRPLPSGNCRRVWRGRGSRREPRQQLRVQHRVHPGRRPGGSVQGFLAQLGRWLPRRRGCPDRAGRAGSIPLALRAPRRPPTPTPSGQPLAWRGAPGAPAVSAGRPVARVRRRRRSRAAPARRSAPGRGRPTRAGASAPAPARRTTAQAARLPPARRTPRSRRPV